MSCWKKVEKQPAVVDEVVQVKERVNGRIVEPTNIVFVKLVPSGKLEGRVLEAAYSIYNVKTSEYTTKSFIFYHPKNHAVHEDTFCDYHSAPTEIDGRSLLQLCQDKTVAKHKIQDFCEAFSEDLRTHFPHETKHISFVGDHIWQTRSLLYPFMFSANPWIRQPRRRLVHFVEFRTFMQPFSVLYTQMDQPFELPQWVFRARMDVESQRKFFDQIVQLARRLPKYQEDGELPASSLCACPNVETQLCACCPSEMCQNEQVTPTGILLRNPDGSTILKQIQE